MTWHLVKHRDNFTCTFYMHNIHTYIHTYIHTDGRADRQTDRQTDKQTLLYK